VLELAPLLGAVEDVRIVEALQRPVTQPLPIVALPAVLPSELNATDPTSRSDHGHGHHQQAEPKKEPTLWLLGKVPVGERPYWGQQLLQDRVQSEQRLLRRATALHVVQDTSPPLPLIFPYLASLQPALAG
jgi:hypothetical protein